MTREQFMALPVHPDWDDGRDGFMWGRLDAVLCPARLLRAELTWDDDGEAVFNAATPSNYHSPQLQLESNRRVPEMSGPGRLETFDHIIIDLADSEAAAIAAAPPLALLTAYAAEFAKLALHDGGADPVFTVDLSAGRL